MYNNSTFGLWKLLNSSWTNWDKILPTSTSIRRQNPFIHNADFQYSSTIPLTQLVTTPPSLPFPGNIENEQPEISVKEKTPEVQVSRKRKPEKLFEIEHVINSKTLPPKAELLPLSQVPAKRDLQRKLPSIEDKLTKTGGTWTNYEHRVFLECIVEYGRNWKDMAKLHNRTATQLRSHAQKFFQRIVPQFPQQDPVDVIKKLGVEQILWLFSRNSFSALSKGKHSDSIFQCINANRDISKVENEYDNNTPIVQRVKPIFSQIGKNIKQLDSLIETQKGISSQLNNKFSDLDTKELDKLENNLLNIAEIAKIIIKKQKKIFNQKHLRSIKTQNETIIGEIYNNKIRRKGENTKKTIKFQLFPNKGQLTQNKSKYFTPERPPIPHKRTKVEISIDNILDSQFRVPLKREKYISNFQRPIPFQDLAERANKYLNINNIGDLFERCPKLSDWVQGPVGEPIYTKEVLENYIYVPKVQQESEIYQKLHETWISSNVCGVGNMLDRGVWGVDIGNFFANGKFVHEGY